MPDRLELQLGTIKSVKEILNWLEFISYSTQKRNLAYQIQYLFFTTRLWNKYRLYGSIAAIFLKDVTMHAASISENLLFIALQDIKGSKYFREQPKADRFSSLIKTAIKEKMISRELGRDIFSLADNRNTLHPKLQSSLDIKVFSHVTAKQAITVVEKLVNELRLYCDK